VPYGEPDPDQDVDEDEAMDDVDSENYGSKTIILHPGSQNLRLGLATDALPKTVPMVIARKSDHAEAELSEPRPKRLKTDGPSEEWFGEEFATQYNAMAQDFKASRRASKRRVLPNSRELVTKWNSTTSPEIISEHNDPLRIEWTELPADASEAPEYFVGDAALRIPEQSKPRYQLSWPLRNGWLNEKDYQSRNVLERDYFLIIEESIKEQLGLKNKKEWSQYSCVFIIPDLYEKVLVAQILRQLIVDFGFQRVCFIQESLAATFGAGFGIACIIDMGAEKTSVACVEDGMVIEESRMNLKYGGHDLTDTFTKMMLFDRFNYSDFNLMRRHDFLLAEELKEKYTTMSDESISVQQFEFHLRAHGQQTRKYTFKIYDEGMLAPMVSGNTSPAPKSANTRHRVTSNHRSSTTPRNLLVVASSSLAAWICTMADLTILSRKHNLRSSTTQDKTFLLLSLPLQSTLLANGENGDDTPRSSVAGSPPPEDIGTPQPNDNAGNTAGAMNDDPTPSLIDADALDRTAPIMPLHRAIITSIEIAAGTDDRRRRDLLGSIMVIGGASKTPHLGAYLESQIRQAGSEDWSMIVWERGF
jgi:actin-related protein 8